MRADDVMLAVADHHSAGKIVAASRFKCGFDDIYLFARFLVALGRAADGVEVGRKTEVLQNALGHGVELRRGNEKTLALTLEMRKQRGNAGIGSVVEPAVLLIVFAEFCDRGVDILFAHEVREGLAERRPTKNDSSRQSRSMPNARRAYCPAFMMPGPESVSVPSKSKRIISRRIV